MVAGAQAAAADVAANVPIDKWGHVFCARLPCSWRCCVCRRVRPPRLRSAVAELVARLTALRRAASLPLAAVRTAHQLAGASRAAVLQSFVVLRGGAALSSSAAAA